jgi:hypothetical protein
MYSYIDLVVSYAVGGVQLFAGTPPFLIFMNHENKTQGYKEPNDLVTFTIELEHAQTSCVFFVGRNCVLGVAIMATYSSAHL